MIENIVADFAQIYAQYFSADRHNYLRRYGHPPYSIARDNTTEEGDKHQEGVDKGWNHSGKFNVDKINVPSLPHIVSQWYCCYRRRRTTDRRDYLRRYEHPPYSILRDDTTEDGDKYEEGVNKG